MLRPAWRGLIATTVSSAAASVLSILQEKYRWNFKDIDGIYTSNVQPGKRNLFEDKSIKVEDWCQRYQNALWPVFV